MGNAVLTFPAVISVEIASTNLCRMLYCLTQEREMRIRPTGPLFGKKGK
jgi:hypothetical protein